MSLPPADDLPPVQYVSADIIQEAFNSGQFWERVKRGELTPKFHGRHGDRHPKTPRSGDPVCTRSQYLVYYTPDDKPIAGVHQYLRPDGTLGGKGRPDPKWLLVGGRELYKLAKQATTL